MDYMDHADGFVAKAFDDEGLSYDVPLTGFLDAFCDKVGGCFIFCLCVVRAPALNPSARKPTVDIRQDTR